MHGGAYGQTTADIVATSADTGNTQPQHPTTAVSGRLSVGGMSLPYCKACGVEHKKPVDDKCRQPRKMKKEKLEPEGAEGGADVEGGQLQGNSAPQTTEVGEDEEERQLLEETRRRACERRKRRLRAALEAGSEEERAEDGPLEDLKEQIRALQMLTLQPRGREESRADGERGGGKKKRKSRRKKTKKKSRACSDTSSDSSSDSSSGTSSEEDADSKAEKRERRRRRKFSLKHYTLKRKAVKKLNFSEFMYAALNWAVKKGPKVGMEEPDYLRYMSHLSYISQKAASYNYVDEAFTAYDTAIREKVVEGDLSAFKLCDSEVSQLHFNMDNDREHGRRARPSRPAGGRPAAAAGWGTGITRAAKGRPNGGACYDFNYSKQGCHIDKCHWDHVCINCRAKDHNLDRCPARKY